MAMCTWPTGDNWCHITFNFPTNAHPPGLSWILISIRFHHRLVESSEITICRILYATAVSANHNAIQQLVNRKTKSKKPSSACSGLAQHPHTDALLVQCSSKPHMCPRMLTGTKVLGTRRHWGTDRCQRYMKQSLRGEL